MKKETFNFICADKSSLFVYKWLPENEIKAVLLLVHGSVEHALRYEHFAAFLTMNNIAVIAPDLRGHGQTVSLNGTYSYFADKNGWGWMIDDLKLLKQQVIEEFEDIPLFVFGHSMGSILVRDFISKDAKRVNGAILMGNTFGNFMLARISLIILRVLLIFRKSNSESPFFHDQLYGRFNRTLKKPKTNADFISRESDQVHKYINDPLCGVTVTLNYAQEIAKGSLLAAKTETFKNTPDNLPIIFLSGMADPVGGKDAIEVKKLYTEYKKRGQVNLEIKLYENARHELLNDVNRDEVMSDILNWINNKLKS